jgi:hypothetical protein
MTLWQTVYRWLGAVLAVAVLLILLILVFGKNFSQSSGSLGPTERRINLVADLGDDKSASCTHDEIERGSAAPRGPLRSTSTACVVVGVVDASNNLGWFFIGRATGAGTVRVPKPSRVGHRLVALSNGAVVPIGTTVAVRCTPDPNARFESWIAEGRVTAGYLDAAGALVAIDCDAP